jgi:CRP-like cAMP-binding protein
VTEVEGFEALRGVLASTGALPERQWLEFRACFRQQRLPKHTSWLRAGERGVELGFVVSGVFRLFYTRPDGREVNKSFVAEGDFLASIHSLIERAPSRLAIESLTAAAVLCAPYEAIAAFYERDMFWQRFGRLMAERLVVKKLEREASLLMDDAAARYEAFLRDHARIEARVPDHHVAKYLGITPEALSRVRRARARR